MSANPRKLARTVTANWPPGSAMPMTWPEASLVDAPPGSALEAAIGAQNLQPASPGDYIGRGGLSN